MPKSEKKRLQFQTNKVLSKLKKEQHSSSSKCDSKKTPNVIELLNTIEDLKKKLNLLTTPEAESTEMAADLTPTIETDNVYIEPLDNQLYGQYYQKEEMVLLKDGIFCRKTVYESAIGSSFKSTHLARRLLDGIVKTDTILKCTLSGQAPKSQGEERRRMHYECLNAKARKAIVEFAIEYAAKKGWMPQNKYEINRAMTQKIGEIKRNFKKTF